MCGVPAHALEQYVERLRDDYDVTIASLNRDSGERNIYTLLSVDHEAERAIDAHEAEFGADGTRVFHNPASDQQPTVKELFEQYKLSVGNTLVADPAYINACRNSDQENAFIEGAAAIQRIVTESGDLQLTKLYFDRTGNQRHTGLLQKSTKDG